MALEGNFQGHPYEFPQPSSGLRGDARSRRALLKLSANARERSAASGLILAGNQPITNWT